MIQFLLSKPPRESLINHWFDYSLPRLFPRMNEKSTALLQVMESWAGAGNDATVTPSPPPLVCSKFGRHLYTVWSWNFLHKYTNTLKYSHIYTLTHSTTHTLNHSHTHTSHTYTQLLTYPHTHTSHTHTQPLTYPLTHTQPITLNRSHI